MKIRRIQYNLGYNHVISFNDDYKSIVSPYFGWDNIQYSVENFATPDESIKLIFKDFNSIIHCRKDGITIMVEDDVDTIKGDAGLMQEFFNIYEKIKGLPNFSKIHQHDLLVYAVDVDKKGEIDDYISYNPLSEDISDFACTYTFERKGVDIKFTIGGFINDDIKKYDLMPFKTSKNDDLLDAKDGTMCELKATEKITDVSFGKFKTLLHTAEFTIKQFVPDHG